MSDDIVTRLERRSTDWVVPVIDKSSAEITIKADTVALKAAAEIRRLRAENERLQRIVTEIVPAIGCFDPENDDQINEIALAYCTKFHALKAENERLRRELAEVGEQAAKLTRQYEALLGIITEMQGAGHAPLAPEGT